MTASVRLGTDRLLESPRLRGARVGIVCNHASVDRGFAHIVDRLAAADGVTLGAIFGPQHGFRSDVQDNMIETPHRDDPGRRVPVYSLYSETREPTAEMLRGLDALVVDLQDIGARIYTYIYTMANCLRAAARHGVPVIVCDRPNPINGVDVEGAALVPGFESFVGQFPIPMRHGMTIGELARLFNAHFRLGAQLEVVEMEGWRREMFADETGLPWVMPSPNMPDARHGGGVSGHGALRGDAAFRRTRHHAAVRARGRAGHRGRALRPRDERAGAARAPSSGPPCSSRRSRSTRSRPAAAARCT